MKKITLSKLKKQAQLIFNTFIRKRDQLPNGKWICISCGKVIDKCHSGHYANTKQFGHLRFDEMNVNAQCIGCNLHKHGNLIGYRQGLVKKYGERKVKELEEKALNTSHQWTQEELWNIIEKYS